MAPLVPVELKQGSLRVSHTPLHLDARRRTPLCFVSHAHADHIARHERTVATPQTLALMAHRLGPLEATVPLRFGERLSLESGDVELELFPAGHVLGAAQVRVTRPDGHRLVYTGDVSLAPALTAAPAAVVPCDTLVVEATFGHPRYVFPPREGVYDEVAAWARTQLGRGLVPVMLTYGLGKGQETIAQLVARGLPVCTDAGIHAVAGLYEALGVPVPSRCFDGAFREGEVGVFTPKALEPLRGGPQKLVTAALTGWALESWGARRSGADVAFPVSDHADFPSLLHYARSCGAREVITLFGFKEELAKALKAHGVFARAVHERVQMSLPLGP